MYASLSPDAGATSLSECRSRCCTNATCTTYQWSDAPKTPPKCWSGDSDDYVDSEGVEWYGETGKLTYGAPCDLKSCTCDGVDLSSLAGKTYVTPVDADGYAYKVSICTEIPRASLPTGCVGYTTHAAAVRYQADSPLDCNQVGSVGPCSAVRTHISLRLPLLCSWVVFDRHECVDEMFSMM
jgi:hypothetical protein